MVRQNMTRASISGLQRFWSFIAIGRDQIQENTCG